ncbi:hypothetical protein [Magnetospirillum sp. SS-4]|uniref:hypothetical protein n=1 Tax=Magnetospirillum sp. SS-4 TaxID=2681465 RepID=UPI001383ACCF|nr:hypothetical protein [Magnetospirillum sp. SS-4]CAA7612851.1 conserved membrane hypothetical protein [Magnetospirillum sp. SS-4]
MGLFRFCRLALGSFSILIGRFPVFLRLSWVCMAVSLISAGVSERHAVAAGIVDLLARGVFVVAWLRLVALDENPPGPAFFRLGRRELLAAFGWMMAEMFVVMPAQVVAASIAMATGTSLQDAIMLTLGLSHLLLGVVFLLPAEAALEKVTGTISWRLPDLVIRGGLAVSIAVFLAWLPINLLMDGVRALPDQPVLQTVALTLARYLGLALTAGTVALIWNALGAEGEGGGG